MKKSRFIFVFILGALVFLMVPRDIVAQEADTSSVVKLHSPHKATIYSALLPGLGQAYNKKYWKIPIIYAGFFALGYFIKTNNTEYKKFRDAYVYVSTGDSSYTDNEYVYKYTESGLQQGRDYYRRNLELSIVLTAVLYVLNIVDAAVDAHLYDFDISDDLSMRIEPAIDMYNPKFTSGGLKLTLRF